MSSTILDVYQLVVQELGDAGVTVVDDPRNVRPPCVIVEPPAVVSTPNAFTVTLSVPVYVLASPPANKDSATALMTVADQVLTILAGYGFTGEPTIYTVGQQDLPAYRIQLNITATRS